MEGQITERDLRHEFWELTEKAFEENAICIGRRLTSRDDDDENDYRDKDKKDRPRLRHHYNLIKNYFPPYFEWLPKIITNRGIKKVAEIRSMDNSNIDSHLSKGEWPELNVNIVYDRDSIVEGSAKGFANEYMKRTGKNARVRV